MAVVGSSSLIIDLCSYTVVDVVIITGIGWVGLLAEFTGYWLQHFYCNLYFW